jgi:ATP-dependent Zn protease
VKCGEGIDEAKEEFMEVIDFLKSPERYRRLGAPGTRRAACGVG